MSGERTPAKKKAQELAKLLGSECPDYSYLKNVFRHLRAELEISVPTPVKQLPDVPTESEIRSYYEAVWHSRNMQDRVMIKTLLYTGVRVSELINIRLEHVDLERCQIQINSGKKEKERVVAFPTPFKEVLATHVETMHSKQARYLFESSWKRQYTDRGIRKILERYAKAAGLPHSMSPSQLRHFLLMWLKQQGLDDTLLQLYSGHSSMRSLEVYSQLSIDEVQKKYDQVIENFPV
ncbi:MAG TPA: integrase [Cyanobacteria bacterium UBA8553]|nr:integrase [Cyanobacteria bacterium UBA8553]HAJ63958.1 integrase [Cyanobacteria bacterium UBA8543]